MTSTPVLPVILSGGSGTRLWPLSRETYPKQLLALTDAATMLQDTALRVCGLGDGIDVSAPLVVCNSEYRFITAEQLQAVGQPASAIVLEPFGRNTAPALTLAALQGSREGRDPVLLVMPADHVIADLQAFHSAVERGLSAALGGAMLTFGIVPTRAETGYGYIRQGCAQGDGTLALDAFFEKPDADTAARYVASGDYLWNSGLFMMRASVWLRAIAHFNPPMLAACTAASETAAHDADFIRIDPAAFDACPSDSIDYAVMEKLATAPELGIAARVVPLDAGWSDVGAWDALWQVRDKDAAGNSVHGHAVLEGTTDSLVFASSRLVAGVGLDNIIVVETPDAVLVADKHRTQDVKKIVTRLKIEGHALADTHRKVHRPWGCTTPLTLATAFRSSASSSNPAPASVCRCTTTVPNTGSWCAVPPKSPTATRSCCCRKTSPPIFRSATYTASPTPARCRWRS